MLSTTMITRAIAGVLLGLAALGCATEKLPAATATATQPADWHPPLISSAVPTTQPVIEPTTLPALSPKAQRLLAQLRGNVNTNGEWTSSYPLLDPDAMKELNDAGLLTHMPIDGILPPSDD